MTIFTDEMRERAVAELTGILQDATWRQIAVAAVLSAIEKEVEGVVINAERAVEPLKALVVFHPSADGREIASRICSDLGNALTPWRQP